MKRGEYRAMYGLSTEGRKEGEKGKTGSSK
jgi:hypothetical protein